MPFVVGEGSRYLIEHSNWSDAEFRTMLIYMAGSVVVGGFLLLGAWMVDKAKSIGLLVLLVANALFLYWAWHGASKEAVLAPPLVLSLVCLLFEESRLLRVPAGQRA